MSKRKYVLLNTNCSLKDSSRNVCFELEAISLILSIAVVDYHHLMCKIQKYCECLLSLFYYNIPLIVYYLNIVVHGEKGSFMSSQAMSPIVFSEI